jgi:hypothetical protein
MSLTWDGLAYGLNELALPEPSVESGEGAGVAQSLPASERLEEK